MADDVALDTNAPFDPRGGMFKFMPPGGPPVTPEVGPQFDTPAPPQAPAPAPAPAPSGYNRFTPQGAPALDTGPPPAPVATQAGPAMGGQVQPVDPGDLDNNKEMSFEDQVYQGRQLSHRPGNPELGRTSAHPDLPVLQRVQEQMTKLARENQQEYRRLKPEVDNLERRIAKESADIQRAALAKEKAERAETSAKYMTPEALQKTFDMTKGSVDTMLAVKQKETKTGNDESRKRADYDLTVTPLATMNVNGDLSKLTQLVMGGVVRNAHLQLTPDMMLRYALLIGTPVGTDDEKGTPGVGFNGKSGKAARNYQLIGRDVDDNRMLRMGDGRVIHMDDASFRQLRQAHAVGLKKMQTWEETQRAKANEPSIKKWVGEKLQQVIPPQGFGR